MLALVYPHELTPNGQSPFVWVFSHAGIPGADTLMTLVIFSAAVSAANSAIYASSRMLWSMAGDCFAPACFGKTNGGGVPVYAILITALLALVSLLTRYIPAQQFYLYRSPVPGRWVAGMDNHWMVPVSLPAIGA